MFFAHVVWPEYRNFVEKLYQLKATNLEAAYVEFERICEIENYLVADGPCLSKVTLFECERPISLDIKTLAERRVRRIAAQANVRDDPEWRADDMARAASSSDQIPPIAAGSTDE